MGAGRPVPRRRAALRLWAGGAAAGGGRIAGLPRSAFTVSTKVGRRSGGWGTSRRVRTWIARPWEGREDWFYRGVGDVRPVWDYTADGVRRSVEESLERLRPRPRGHPLRPRSRGAPGAGAARWARRRARDAVREGSGGGHRGRPAPRSPDRPGRHALPTDGRPNASSAAGPSHRGSTRPRQRPARGGRGRGGGGHAAQRDSSASAAPPMAWKVRDRISTALVRSQARGGHGGGRRLTCRHASTGSAAPRTDRGVNGQTVSRAG